MSVGDRLASGAVRAQFGPPDVTQEKWNAIFKDYKPGSGGADTSKNGDVKDFESIT